MINNAKKKSNYKHGFRKCRYENIITSIKKDINMIKFKFDFGFDNMNILQEIAMDF